MNPRPVQVAAWGIWGCLAIACPAPPPEPSPAALSAEDERLIATNPDTLSPELRRKRAHALRRKIMQTPDAPAARILHDLNEAYRAGELDPRAKPSSGPVFHAAPKLAEQAPSHAPSGRPPAGVRSQRSGGSLPAP